MISETFAERKWTSTARFFLVTAAIVITIAGLKSASDIFAPLLLAIFFALLINPVLSWLKSKGLATWLSYLVLAVSILLIGAAIILLISVSLNSLQENIPVYQQNLAKITASFKTSLANLGIDVSGFKVSNIISTQSLASAAGRLISVLVNQLTGAALALLLLLFLLIEAPGFPAKAAKAFGAESPIVQRLGSFGNAVVTYVKVLTLTNLFVGVVWGILLVVLGVDAALLWGFLAFILQYIPTIGLIIAAVPAILIALLGQGPSTALIVLVSVIIINSLSANLIMPRLSAKQLELSTTVAFFSFIFWAWVFGAIGGVLSVVLTVGVKSVLEGYPESKGFAMILGPAPSPEETFEANKKEAA